MRITLLLLAILIFAPLAIGQEKAEGAKVYKQAVPAVLWIHSKHDRGLATGSGSLIDKDRRLVLTNYHVVQENPTVRVFFPVFRDGAPIAEKSYYVDRLNRLAVHGKVIAVDKIADLAIIRIDSVPEKLEAIALAPVSPDPGDSVHSIGNAGKSGALFGYVRGTVRQVYNKAWQAELEPRKVAQFKAKVIETDSPTNPGDSGGPLLNDKGQLIGVTQGGAINANSVSTFVDVSQVKKLLDVRAVKEVKADEKPAAIVKREQALTIKDGAKLFSAEAIKDADAVIAELFKKDTDVILVTFPVAPTEKLDELRKETPANRTAFFRKLLHDRMERDRVSGIGIVICDDPKSLYIDLSADVVKKFPDKFSLQIRDALMASLKDKKPDDGLKAAIKLIQDNLGKAK